MSTDISAVRAVSGFIGACLVDADSGLVLGSQTGSADFDPMAAANANTEIVRAKNAAMQSLGIDEGIDDILITQGSQLHLICPLANNPMVFMYLALDKKTSNLGDAKQALKTLEGTLTI